MLDTKAIYDQQFMPARNQAWHERYLRSLGWAQTAEPAEFRTPEFQRRLWEDEGVTGVGPGTSVNVPGAYTDPEIVDALWALRLWAAPADSRLAAQHLDAEFERILGLVTPRHNARRPSARLARIFALLRPYEVACLMDRRRTVAVRQWLERPGLGLGFMGQNVISRQAIREAVGPEPGLEEAVNYSQFAWFIWELIEQREKLGTTAPPPAADPAPQVTDAPALALLPAVMQRKGMFFVTENLRVLQSIVRAAENGLEKEDLIQQVAEEAPTLNRSSRSNVIAQAVGLNLLTVDGGTYRPTNTGKGLLEGESAADMLTPIFVRTVFGFALVLADLRDEGRLTRGEIADRARTYYPRWTSDFAPNSLVNWLRALGLATITGVGRAAVIELTETGEYWASGLPQDTRDAVHLLADEQPPEDTTETAVVGADESRRTAFEPASVEEVLVRFAEDPQLRRFVFSETQLRLVHAALHSAQGKRFILLAGLSGTGKTSMARSYAQAYCEAKGLEPGAHYQQVAVWPDWTDPTGLLGFVNPLAEPPTFHETPALRLLLDADRNPDKPYFLCLDEMNLARVEHYFAPFLSAMEGDEGRLALHAGDEPIDRTPPSIAWPRNLFVIGTVNMDETTHPFSDRVLDRAFTFEFWDVDLEAWREKAGGASPELLGAVFRVLAALHAALAPARRHFGYRTCDEVLGFCGGGSHLPPMVALDTAVLAKVLPKVRGESDGALPAALEAAAAVCTSEGLVQSAAKLAQMRSALSAHGVVRFWS